MSSPPVFHLLAGPNGAGKSTLYRALVQDDTVGSNLTFVNADLYERDNLQHISDPEQRSEVAREWAEAERASKLANRESFVSETVFSHVSKLALVKEAIDLGYVVALYVVALDDPQRLLARVKRRVGEGGHDVPPERILARYPRTLANLAQAVRMASVAYLYDAWEIEDGGHQLVAVCQGTYVTTLTEKMPRWTQQVLGDTP